MESSKFCIIKYYMKWSPEAKEALANGNLTKLAGLYADLCDKLAVADREYTYIACPISAR